MARKKRKNESFDDTNTYLNINDDKLNEINNLIKNNSQDGYSKFTNTEEPDRALRMSDAEYLLDHSCILNLFRGTKSKFQKYKIINILLLAGLIIFPVIALILSSISNGSLNIVSAAIYILPIMGILSQIFDIAKLKGVENSFELANKLPFKSQKIGSQYTFNSSRFRNKIWLSIAFLFLGLAFDFISISLQNKEITLNAYTYAIIAMIALALVNLIVFKFVSKNTLDKYEISFAFGGFDYCGNYSYGYFIDLNSKDIIFSEVSFSLDNIYLQDFKDDFEEEIKYFLSRAYEYK